MKKLFARVALVGFMAWAAIAFGLRSREVAGRPVSYADLPVMLWRSGSVYEQEWAQFFDTVRQRVPEGETVLVQADQIDPADEFFLALWGAYHLPRHNVIRRSNLEFGRPARYVLSTNGERSLVVMRQEGNPLEGSHRVLVDGVGRLVLLAQPLSVPATRDSSE